MCLNVVVAAGGGVKLVSNQSEEERKRAEQLRRAEFAKRVADGALRRLTANLLRVVRGAGRAYEIPAQIHECEEAIQEYRAAAGLGFSDQELSDMICVRQDPYRRDIRMADLEWAHGIETMMRGSLQLAASRLLGQRTQERAGESDMIDGVRTIERSWEMNRNDWEAERKATIASRPKAARPKTKARKAAAPKPPPPEPPTPQPPTPPKGKPVPGHRAALAAYKAARGIK